jgi:hypothetical protein
MTIQENGRFGGTEEGLARHQQFNRFGSAIAGQPVVKVIGDICKPFKHMEKVSSRVADSTLSCFLTLPLLPPTSLSSFPIHYPFPLLGHPGRHDDDHAV